MIINYEKMQRKSRVSCKLVTSRLLGNLDFIHYNIGYSKKEILGVGGNI